MKPAVNKFGLRRLVFVSHSDRDLEPVRPIRTELARRRHNPLLFFLKCLEAVTRLPELIRADRVDREAARKVVS